MSKEKTVDEIREEFLAHVRVLIDYWDTVGGVDAPKTQKDRLAGLAFSIMSTLDGCSMDVPGFLVIPNVHESDKQFNIDNGEDWYPKTPDIDDACDIGGCLHELLKV